MSRFIGRPVHWASRENDTGQGQRLADRLQAASEAFSWIVARCPNALWNVYDPYLGSSVAQAAEHALSDLANGMEVVTSLLNDIGPPAAVVEPQPPSVLRFPDPRQPSGQTLAEFITAVIDHFEMHAGEVEAALDRYARGITSITSGESKLG